MKLIIRALACALISFNASSNSIMPADGFLNVQASRVKMIEGVFHYCDQANASQDICYDVAVRGPGKSSDLKSESVWREADEYIKYSIRHDFQYVGMTATNNGVFLYYRKMRD